MSNNSSAKENIHLEEINEIFIKIQQDPSLFSTIDINTLLNKIEHKNNEYLENKTAANVATEIYNIIASLGIPHPAVDTFCRKLVEYRYVDEIRELHKGKHVRWISQKKTPFSLTNGGIVMDIMFKDSGIHVLCKNSQNRFTQYKFDDCFTFQKLTLEEQLILSAYDYLSNGGSAAGATTI